MKMAKPIIFIVLILFHAIPSSKSCLSKITEIFTSLSQPDEAQVDTDHTFSRNIYLEEPLYYKDSISEFLELCKNVDKPIKDDVLIKSNQNKASDCTHPPDPSASQAVLHSYTLIELYLLKEAQEKLRLQRKTIRSVPRAVISLVLFLIPLCMAIFLIYKRHFYIGDLPLIGKFFMPRKNQTEGVKYKLFMWMEFLILSGDHPTLRNMGGHGAIHWFKYNKDDEVLDPVKIKIEEGSTRFHFRKRMASFQIAGGTDADGKKGNSKKKGWDFVSDNPRHGSHGHGASEPQGNGDKKPTASTKESVASDKKEKVIRESVASNVSDKKDDKELEGAGGDEVALDKVSTTATAAPSASQVSQVPEIEEQADSRATLTTFNTLDP